LILGKVGKSLASVVVVREGVAHLLAVVLLQVPGRQPLALAIPEVGGGLDITNASKILERPRFLTH
jgi:hypothetical protein